MGEKNVVQYITMIGIYIIIITSSRHDIYHVCKNKGSDFFDQITHKQNISISKPQNDVGAHKLVYDKDNNFQA